MTVKNKKSKEKNQKKYFDLIYLFIAFLVIMLFVIPTSEIKSLKDKNNELESSLVEQKNKLKVLNEEKESLELLILEKQRYEHLDFECEKSLNIYRNYITIF